MGNPRLVCIALLLAAAVPAGATNTGKDPVLRVTLHDGPVIDGRVRFKKTKLEVKGRRTKKLLYREVSSISMVPPPEKEKLQGQFKRKKKRLKEGEDAKAWARLGSWARKRGLEDEALSAFEDWFALLNGGRTVTGIGSSDTHTVRSPVDSQWWQ